MYGGIRDGLRLRSDPSPLQSLRYQGASLSLPTPATTGVEFFVEWMSFNGQSFTFVLLTNVIVAGKWLM